MATVGAPVPVGDDWIARRFKALEDEIRKLRTARSGNAMQVNGQPGIVITNGGGIEVDDGGNVTCKGGGLFTVEDADGNPIVLFGTGPTGNTGFQVQRPDGTPSLWGITTGGGFAALFDKQGNYVVTDDSVSGQGLARPHITMPAMVNTNVALWPSTTAGSFTGIAGCFIERQNARISWTIGIAAAGSTTGEFRLMCNGTQLGSTQAVSDNSIVYWSDDASWPAGIAMYTDVFLSLESRVTAGPGSAWGQCYRLKGNQS